MISKVVFKIKSNIRSWSDQDISFITKEGKQVSIGIKGTKCELLIVGNNEKDNYQYNNFNMGIAGMGRWVFLYTSQLLCR